MVRGTDYTGCRSAQGLGRIDAGSDKFAALLQGRVVNACRVDFLLRYRALQLLEALDTSAGNGKLRLELGQLRFLVSALDGAADRAQIRHHFAPGDFPPRHRHAFGAGDDTARKRRLNPAAGLRVGDDLAVEFDRRGEVGDAYRLCAHTQLTLHRLGDKQATIGQTLRCRRDARPILNILRARHRRAGRGFFGVFAVILVAVGEGIACDPCGYRNNEDAAGA